MGLSTLGLVPSFKDVHTGSIINLKATLVIYDPHGLKHLLRSHGTDQFFTAQGRLTNLPVFTFLQCEVMQASPRPHVDASKGFVLGHTIPTEQM